MPTIKLAQREAWFVICPGKRPFPLLSLSKVVSLLGLCPTDKLRDIPSPRHDARTAAAEANGVELL